MRVLIFITLVIVASVAETVRPGVWCQPHSTYSASTDDVYGGGTCYCNDVGSIAYCRTIYNGVNFSFTQTLQNKRGNLAMCLTNDTCFKLPRKTELYNSRCQIYVQPSGCIAEENGMTFNFIRDFGRDDVVDGTVTVNGTTYSILPQLINGEIVAYM